MPIERESTPITGWFIPRVIPHGSAPESVKASWLDVPLPFRYPLPEGATPDLGGELDGSGVVLYEDGICIRSLDAVKALVLFERNDAARWWLEYYGGGSRLEGRELLFGKNEGEIQPASLTQCLLPGIESFDSIDVVL